MKSLQRGTVLIFNLYATYILYIGQTYRYFPEYSFFYIFSQQIYLIIFFRHSLTIFFYSFTKCRVFPNVTVLGYPVPLSRNLGALTSWNPLGLSRPVMGLLYLYFTLPGSKIFAFYINGVLNFKCPATGPKGLSIFMKFKFSHTFSSF